MPEPTGEQRFWLSCKQTLDAAKLGQYGPDFTAQNLRDNLNDFSKSIGINWGPASNSPFSMVDPGQVIMDQYINEAVACYEKYLASQKTK